VSDLKPANDVELLNVAEDPVRLLGGKSMSLFGGFGHSRLRAKVIR
jgi:hypothetical protein